MKITKHYFTSVVDMRQRVNYDNNVTQINSQHTQLHNP